VTSPPPEGPGLGLVVGNKRVLICVGSGGVGKTSTAATIGLLATRQGIKTLVMTIDPARRLAAALGLEELDHKARAVPDEKLAAAGIGPGLYDAIMLEPKRTFDALVRRYAPDAETVQRLLESKIYQQVSSRLAGSQEYAAMEMLHAIREEDRYKLLVLDTPPTANALDFLNAPGKMVEAVQSPAVSLFVRSYEKAGKLSLDMLGFGASYIVRRLARFVGSEFLNDIAEFLTRLSSMLEGMHERAAAVQEMLADDDVGFVIVTSPDPGAVDQAIHFAAQLEEREMDLAAIVINRVHPLHPVELEPLQIARKVEASTRMSREQAKPLAQALARSHQQLQSLARADSAQVKRLMEQCGDKPIYLPVPLFNEDIYDMLGLLMLGRFLGVTS
jgi:anion-transporting  ArsA/GET3 family ATPase